AYPGTCRDLPDAERERRRKSLGPGRVPALRLRAEADELTIDDLTHGPYTGVVDDVVLRRGDGVWAYNLAVVVDDSAQGVDQVVRGEDLLSSTPRQAHLAGLLGIARPEYAHVPLAVNASGDRLAKRDGAVTLADLAEEGTTTRSAVARIVASLGGPDGADSIDALRGRLTPASLRDSRWTVAWRAAGIGRPGTSTRIIDRHDHFTAAGSRTHGVWAAGRGHPRAGAQHPGPRHHHDLREPRPRRLRRTRQPVSRLPDRPVRRRHAHQQRRRDQGRPPLPRPGLRARVPLARRARHRRRVPPLPAGLRPRRRDQ